MNSPGNARALLTPCCRSPRVSVAGGAEDESTVFNVMEPLLPQSLEALDTPNQRSGPAAVGMQLLEKCRCRPSAGADISQRGIDLASVPVHKEPHAYKGCRDDEKIYLKLAFPNPCPDHCMFCTALAA